MPDGVDIRAGVDRHILATERRGSEGAAEMQVERQLGFDRGSPERTGHRLETLIGDEVDRGLVLEPEIE